MKIEVHIKDQMFHIHCGEGNQKIRWLGDVAVFRYEHFFEPIEGTPKGVRFETGEFLPMDQLINQHLEDEMHVWVILKSDMEALGFEKDQSKKPQTSQSGFRIRPGTSLLKKK